MSSTAYYVTVIDGYTCACINIILDFYLIFLTCLNWKEFQKGGVQYLTFFTIIAWDTVVALLSLAIGIGESYLGKELTESDFLCAFSSVALVVSYGMSLISITLCSFDRYQVILHGKKMSHTLFFLVQTAAFTAIFLVCCLPMVFRTGYELATHRVFCVPFKPPDQTSPDTPAILFYLPTILLMSAVMACLAAIAIWYYKIYHFAKKTFQESSRYNAPSSIQQHCHQGPSRPKTEGASTRPMSRAMPQDTALDIRNGNKPCNTMRTQGQPTGISSDAMREAKRENRTRRETQVFYKIAIIAISTVLLWSPVTTIFTFTAFSGVRVSPSVYAAASIVHLKNGPINAILTVTIIEHYRKWSRVFVGKVKSRLRALFACPVDTEQP